MELPKEVIDAFKPTRKVFVRKRGEAPPKAWPAPVIRSDVPLDSRTTRNRRCTSGVPLEHLPPPDENGAVYSFFMGVDEDMPRQKLRSKINNAVQAYKRKMARYGVQVEFTMRARVEEGKEGYRVWRTK